MCAKWFLLTLALLAAVPDSHATWSMFIYPFNWLRDMFRTASSPEEFSRRIGEFEEFNVTFLNDSRKDMQLWPNLSIAEKPTTNVTSNLTMPDYVDVNSTVNWNESTESYPGDNTLVEVEEELEAEDKWKDYFEQLLTHDTAFCFSLLVCEISAQPDNFLEYGRRVAHFFQTYRPSASNSAAWWYVNAAELGRKGRSLSECRANYPFCFVDTRQLVSLLEVPTQGGS